MDLKAKRVIQALLGLFVLLLLGRFVFLVLDERSWQQGGAGSPSGFRPMFELGNVVEVGSGSADFSSGVRNYSRYKAEAAGQGTALQTAGTHYERIATVGFETKRYEEDEKSIQAWLKDYKAIVQAENRSGLVGRRHLSLSIGIEADRFDAAVEALKTLARLNAIEIQKTDRTKEFHELNAKRLALTKKRDALQAFKQRGGKISELVELEEKIFAVESEIQELGVQLSGFEGKADLCTVRLSLTEQGQKRAWFWLAGEAAEWAFYRTLLFGFLALVVAALAASWLKVVRYDWTGKATGAAPPASKSASPSRIPSKR